MTVDIIVIRDEGDKAGEDIVEPLVGDVSTARNRGRNELDERSNQKIPIRYTTVFRSGVRLGQLARVVDSLFGEVFEGKITSIKHVIATRAAVTELVIERIQDDG